MDDAIKAKKGRCIEKSDREGIRKGPWSTEEDTILNNYVATHGDRLWNSLARSSGLKRSGKSCRLRWLNYLRPNVRRGNITRQEQIRILDLHSRWGNRWSKIAQHLPGRTDNEIKNYWRTRVSKQAKQLNCDVNSEKFRDALRYVWMPLLLERVQPPSTIDPSPSPSPTESASASAAPHQHGLHLHSSGSGTVCLNSTTNSSSFSSSSSSSSSVDQSQQVHSDSGHSVSSDQTGQNDPGLCPIFNSQMFEYTATTTTTTAAAAAAAYSPLGVACGDLLLESLWSDENIWVLPPLCDDLAIEDNYFLP